MNLHIGPRYVPRPFIKVTFGPERTVAPPNVNMPVIWLSKLLGLIAWWVKCGVFYDDQRYFIESLLAFTVLSSQ